MKPQTPLTNMENRWVHSTKEAFDALVDMGYEPYNKVYSYDMKVLFITNVEVYKYKLYQNTLSFLHSVKQAYYHNGHFYDQPYEEFTITEEKVPFPELEDIEWAMVEAPEWMLDTSFRFGGGFVFAGVHHIYMNNTKDDADKMFVRLNKSEYSVIKALHENSKDFKVTWKLKEKINRKLHENMALAMAIGRYISENEPVMLNDKLYITGCSRYVYFTEEWNERSAFELHKHVKLTLPDDYIIPDQVLLWMKEYDHTS